MADLYRIPCAHCAAEGMCARGPAKSSCAVCVRANGLAVDRQFEGLVCSVCKGLGSVESKTEILHNRIVPTLALATMYIALSLLYIFRSSANFNSVLAFATTLTGSITGYYFADKSSRTSQSGRSTGPPSPQ
jgi:hypothetical protein